MIDFSNLNKLREELSTAIHANNLARIESLINRSSNKTTESSFETSNSNSSTSSCINGTTQTLMNLNYLDKEGQTPLHLACATGNLAACRLLMESGASQAIKNKEGWFPIHVASYLGHVDIVVYLLDESKSGKDTLIHVYDSSATTTAHSGSGGRYSHDFRIGCLYRSTTRSPSPNEDDDDDDNDEDDDDDYSDTSSDTCSSSGDEEEDDDVITSSIYSHNKLDFLHLSIAATKNSSDDQFLFDDLFELKNLDISAKDFIF